MIQILRIEQWIKNFVIFIPALLSKKTSVFLNFDIYLIFLCFSFLASSTYIFNDINDIEQDKEHPIKKYRPLPSGKISLQNAQVLGLTLLFLSFLIIFFNYKILIIYFLFYLLITVFYSKKLKYMKYFDFLSISILFFIRILIGGIASDVDLTNYFIFFIISILNLISIGKKLSISNNKNINPNLKIKKHLISRYKNNELKNLSIFSSLLSVSIFLFWIFEQNNFSIYQNLLSMISTLLIIIFCYKFVMNSINHKTENFVHWALKINNFILIMSICSLIFLKVY